MVQPLGGVGSAPTGIATPHTPEPLTRAFGARRMINVERIDPVSEN